MKREATITLCGLYRYDLTRTVQPACLCERCIPVIPTRPGYVLWILANPSTANAEEDDATERRGWDFTSTWGYGKMVFVNINPFRSTNPSRVLRLSMAVSAYNMQQHIAPHIRQAALVIAAWGTAADPFEARASTPTIVSLAGHKLYTLGLTKNGIPRHPLYLPKATTPEPFRHRP